VTRPWIGVWAILRRAVGISVKIDSLVVFRRSLDTHLRELERECASIIASHVGRV